MRMHRTERKPNFVSHFTGNLVESRVRSANYILAKRSFTLSVLFPLSIHPILIRLRSTIDLISRRDQVIESTRVHARTLSLTHTHTTCAQKHVSARRTTSTCYKFFRSLSFTHPLSRNVHNLTTFSFPSFSPVRK